MARSTQAKTKQLYFQMKKVFKGVYTEAHATLEHMIEDALKSVDKEIYAISLTQHMNNRWSVFMMFGTGQNVVDVELDNVKADIPTFIAEVKLSGQSFVNRCHEDTKALAAKEINDMIGGWVILDMSKLKRKINATKSTASEDEIISIKRKIRVLRHELWDLEDDIKEHLNKPSLAAVLDKHKEQFPLGVEAALSFLPVS